MPNIEIHGFLLNDAERLRALISVMHQIEEALQGLGLAKEAVMDVISSDTRSCDGKRRPMPYLRVCSTNPGERKKIAEVLHRELPMLDIETLAIETFIPKTL